MKKPNQSTAAAFVAALALLLAPASAVAEDFNPPFPRIMMMIWGGASPAHYAEFDWVVSTIWSGDELEKAKEINPGLITSWTFDVNCCSTENGNRECPDEWRVKGPDGSDIFIYGLCYLGDTTEYCGLFEGKTYTESVIERIVAEDYTFWTGWNSDGLWENIDWLGDSIDPDGDGDSDSDDYDAWNSSRLDFLSNLHAAMPEGATITVWGGKTYWGEGHNYMNGIGIEMFGAWGGWGWDRVNGYYEYWHENAVEPRLFYINGHYSMDTEGDTKSKNKFRNVRFGLATTLMRDGFYGYEDGDGGFRTHNEHNWVRLYDEYAVPLGYPLADFAQIRDFVFCRFFDHGAMILNANAHEETVTEQDLKDAAALLGLDWDAISGDGGHYYRFAGQQNPDFNDGSRFDEITLPGGSAAAGNPRGDGILLVRSAGMVVMAPMIIDTEDYVTSPGAENAVLDGFQGQCGEGFRIGYGRCNESTPMYHHTSSSTGNGHTATFDLTLVTEGEYRVFEFHPPMDGWDVPHTIHHADGEETVNVDQRENHEQWNLLGTFRFTSDSPARVVISDQASGDEVAADAIRFEFAGCGDGIVEGDEACDGNNLDHETCESRGYSGGGTLRCLADCSGFDESGCEGDPPDDTGEDAAADAGEDAGSEDASTDAVFDDGRPQDAGAEENGTGTVEGGCGCRIVL